MMMLAFSSFIIISINTLQEGKVMEEEGYVLRVVSGG